MSYEIEFAKLKTRNAQLLKTISNQNGNIDEQIAAKKELYSNKIRMLDLIHSKDDSKRLGLTAREYKKRFKNKKHKPVYSCGIPKIDDNFDGGFETGQLINIAGQSFAGKCVDGETEFLSPNGWVKIKDYNNELVAQYRKDGTVEFIKPIRFFKDKTDKFYHITTKQVDMMVTSSHRIPYLTSKGNIQIKRFDELYNSGVIWNARFINSFDLIKENGLNITDEYLRLMICVMADGTRVDNSNKWRVRLKKENKKNRIRELFSNANIKFEEKIYSNDEDYINFYFYDENMTKDMKILWKCSDSQLKVIIDEMIHWDGGYSKKTNTKMFFTTIKEHADFMQYAISSCGYMSRIREFNRIGQKHSDGKYKYKSIEYTVDISKWKNTTLSSNKTNKEDKIKEIKLDKETDCYCFTMGHENKGNDMWIARRNGYIFVTGNTELSMSICANFAISKKVGWFNFEMGERNFVRRLDRILTNDDQWDNFYIDEDSRNIDKMIQEMELLIEEGYLCFGIDSKMKIQGGNGKEDYQRFSNISTRLSEFAQTKDCLVFFINQMNEEDIKNQRLALKGSGDQIYDSDIIFFLVIEEDKTNAKKIEDRKRFLICNKNRQTEKTFRIEISKDEYLYMPKITTFESQSKKEVEVKEQDLDSSFDISMFEVFN